MLRFAVSTLVLTVALVQHATAQPVVFVVRHAERADAESAGPSMMKDDPELSAKGRERAESLARMLRDSDIRAIYTTELRRTQQTAAPLAAALGVKAVTVASADVPTLLQKVRGETGNVLIVGHSNTVPKILGALGVAGPIEIGAGEYDNLFIVLRDTPARLVRLRY